MTKVATVLADSKHPYNETRLTTMRLIIPTLLLAQFNTHRWFSRNASSMRAIPTKRLLVTVAQHPYVPPEFGKNKAGMTASEELPAWKLAVAKAVFKIHLWISLFCSWFLAKLGGHKQWVNRLLTSHSYTLVCVTGSEKAWLHFFRLRSHPDADPGIKLVSDAAKQVYMMSTPKTLQQGEWHLPLVQAEERNLPIKQQIVHSVARCARVSLTTFDKPERSSTLEEDQDLYNKLTTADPPHMSPTEHQAVVQISKNGGGNLGPGWGQYRKLLPNEV